MNPNFNLSNLNIGGDNSGSALSLNECIGDTDVMTPSHQRSMSLPSSSFSPLSPGTFSSIMSPSPPSLPPVQRSPRSGLPPVIPSSSSFPSAPLSDYDQSMLPVRRSPNLGLRRNFLEGIDTIHVGEHSQEESQRMAFHNVQNEIAPSRNVLTRSVSTDSFVVTIFTEEEMKTLKVDKKLAELAEKNPREAKRKLVNRAAAARSAARRLQCVADLQTKVKTLESELTRTKTMYEQLQEYQMARDKAFNDLEIVHGETLKHMQTLRDWNGQLNAELTEVKRELNEYRRKANMHQRRNSDFI